MKQSHIPSHIMALDDPGDLNAEKGSAKWARAVRYQLQKLGANSKATLRDFQTYLQVLEETRGYQQLDNAYGHPFASLAAFAAASIPYGLGYDPDVILHIQEETRDMLLKDSEEEANRQLSGQKTSRWDKNITCNLQVMTQEERAKHNGISIRSQVKLDFIADEREDLFHEVRNHTMSIDKAFHIAKGHIPETPFQTLLRA